MNWNRLIRQTHRWLSIVFSLAALANIAAIFMKINAPWLGLCAAVPLIPMLATGLYMFVLPYVARGSARA